MVSQQKERQSYLSTNRMTVFTIIFIMLCIKLANLIGIELFTRYLEPFN